MENENSERRVGAIEQLLDDPSPVVQAAVREEIVRMGEVGLRLLRRAMEQTQGEVAQRAERLFVDLTAKDAAESFLEAIRGGGLDLETGMFQIAQVMEPGLRIEGMRRRLDAIAERCRQLRTLPMQPMEQIKVLNRVFFHEEGFRGNAEDYENPANSALPMVLSRRLGIPLSLSVAYILVAERLGLELEPVAFPGHFLVGCFENDGAYYIDCFERGRIRRPDALVELLERQGITAEFHHLSPAPVVEVLCRACRNLERHLNLRGQRELALQFHGFVKAFEQAGSGESGPLRH